MSKSKTQIGAQYRHYKKGTIYSVLAIGKDCEDPTREFVVYQSTVDGDTWVRERGDFEATVNVNGDFVPRFKRLHNE